jgi:tRNA G46 methylase TrmB
LLNKQGEIKMTTDLTTLTTAELQAEVQRRVKEEQVQRYKEQLEKERIKRELAEVGKKEALVEIEELKVQIHKAFDRIEELAKKHMIYVDIRFGHGELNISEWGRDVEGWDSSSC